MDANAIERRIQELDKKLTDMAHGGACDGCEDWYDNKCDECEHFQKKKDLFREMKILKGDWNPNHK